ncbi:MAG: LuxR C-terminal-related transcriptional regulator [Actinomycetota bacterium]
MIDDGARAELGRLVDRIRNEPARLPLEELASLSRRSLTVDVDNAGATPVVYVRPAPHHALARLSPREREVVALLAGGFSNEQIASALFVSLATVKDHLHSVFTKTGLSSRTQVVAAWYGGLDDQPATPEPG